MNPAPPAIPVTIDELLNSREERALLQRELLASYSGCALVSFMVNFPGPFKAGEDAVFIHKEGIRALEELLEPIPSPHSEQRELATGREYFRLTRSEPAEIKRICCRLEEGHPLGRLFDIDVIGKDGVPISRTELGLEPRGCLLCGENPTVCRRRGAHTIEELTGRIAEMVRRYREKALYQGG
ncbi:MAG: citrate lyase holo-[acyl-carrier protein] synthase [Oscillospiraceae bacterium]|jgi:holo-ACP synthase|nr:citrate lyase holo-[acyl-carrier protein] synthase [Oscillospiraceae bacterium]